MGPISKIRVEWEDSVEPHAIADAIGILKLTEFKPQGQFVLELSRHLHPADAILHIQSPPGHLKALIRIRGFDIEQR